MKKLPPADLREQDRDTLKQLALRLDLGDQFDRAVALAVRRHVDDDYAPVPSGRPARSQRDLWIAVDYWIRRDYLDEKSAAAESAIETAAASCGRSIEARTRSIASRYRMRGKAAARDLVRQMAKQFPQERAAPVAQIQAQMLWQHEHRRAGHVRKVRSFRAR